MKYLLIIALFFAGCESPNDYTQKGKELILKESLDRTWDRGQEFYKQCIKYSNKRDSFLLYRGKFDAEFENWNYYKDLYIQELNKVKP